MDRVRQAPGDRSNAPACSPSATTATPSAVPVPRVMFTIPPAAAASRAGTAVMISALFAGVRCQASPEKAEQHH